MDKISSILPSSSRVKSVDLSEAPPVRPGAPANGRAEGRNSIRDRFTLSEQAKDLALKDTLTYKNPKESMRAKMVEQLGNKFFETRLKPVADEQSEPITEKVSASLKPIEIEPSEVSETNSTDSSESEVVTE